MTQLGFAFIGGLLLNLMPCVLPVISLKVLSFLQQAGESRGRILMLNLWYCAGVDVGVHGAGHPGGCRRTSLGRAIYVVLVQGGHDRVGFRHGAEFLGVWEIPIPGFVGAGHGSQLQAKEGASGAFFKGVFATILATPCSGPFLGPLFGYLLTQPPLVTYCVFGAVGLGMASPYVVLGDIPGDCCTFCPGRAHGWKPSSRSWRFSCWGPSFTCSTRSLRPISSPRSRC